MYYIIYVKYTSILVIGRLDLILNLEGISFYLWFNEQLLDKEALQVLVAKKETELKKTIARKIIFLY